MSETDQNDIASLRQELIELADEVLRVTAKLRISGTILRADMVEELVRLRERARKVKTDLERRQ